jgi:hypothetical protein
MTLFRPELARNPFMATHQVNLDALILKQDFESGPEASASLGENPTFNIEDLRRTELFYTVLRKPDFQRDTASWSPEMIVDFVECFLDGKMIPPMIIWHSKQSQLIYIIDGAHRVSSLIAWANDDYGDGEISREFFKDNISSHQKKLHIQTKELIEKRIGSYHQIYHGAKEVNPRAIEIPQSALRGRNITNRRAPILKVDGSAEIAEESYFKINANPVLIDSTELDVIHARRKPNAIATRAIIRAGRGHKYWGKLPNSEEIESLSSEVFQLLFGQFEDIKSTSPDLPRAGQPYSEAAFKMVLDIVNMFNDVKPVMWEYKKSKKVKKTEAVYPDDLDGKMTIQYLNKVKNIARLVSDNSDISSFGFDPAVYSYGATGKFHTGAFIASLRFADDIHRKGLRDSFKKVRSKFEDFLVNHKYFINILNQVKGSRTRSVDACLVMFHAALDCYINGTENESDILAKLKENPSLTSLEPQNNLEPVKVGKRFSKDVTAAGVVAQILESRPRCKVCSARLPPHSRSRDHKIPKSQGGLGSLENLQWTHPCCNSSKENLSIPEE